MSGIVNTTGAVSGIIGTTVGTPAAGGITHASQWKIPSPNVTGSPTAVSAAEHSAPPGYGVLGASMVKDGSHIFTFPVTGYWWIRFQVGGYSESGAGYVAVDMVTTHNNSTYANAGPGAVYDYSTSADRMTIAEDYVFKVEDTANYKVRFSIAQQNTSNLILHTVTSMTFIRLGAL